MFRDARSALVGALAGAAVIGVLSSIAVPAHSQHAQVSRAGANWAGNATGAVTTVATLTGTPIGAGECVVSITNKTNTPVATGYTSIAFPLTFANGQLVCHDTTVCITDHYVRDSASTALALVTGGGNVAVRIEVGGGCL